MLAKQLLQRLKARIEANRDLDGIHVAAVKKILGLIRPSKTICWRPCSRNADDNPQRLAFVRRLATEDRTLAKTLSEGMSERAGRLWKAGKQVPGDALLAAAEAVCPDRHEACVQQRLAWLKKRSAEKDYTDVAKGLQAVNLDDFPPALRGELAGICLQAARGLAKADQAAAQRALDKAFQLSPVRGGTEANSTVVDRPAPRAKRPEGDALQGFSDGVSQGRPRRRRAEGALGHRAEVGGRGKRDDAVGLGQWLLENTPDSPLRKEIDEKIAAWQAGPAANQPPARPPVDRAWPPSRPSWTPNWRNTSKSRGYLGVINAMQDKDVWIIEVGDSCCRRRLQADADESCSRIGCRKAASSGPTTASCGSSASG